MNRFIDYIINTNIIVACSAFSLYKITEFLFNISDLKMGIFVFFSTLIAYNYMRLFNNVKNNICNLRNTIFCAILFLAFLILLFDIYFVLLVLPVIVICIIYPIYTPSSINNYSFNLRSIPFLKIFLIALVWSYVTCLMPLLYYNIQIDYYLMDCLLQRFLFVLAVSLPFDIRDMKVDRIRTIPNTVGVVKSKYFGWFCLLIIQIILIIDLVNNVITLPIFLALFISLEITSVVLYFTNARRSKFFYGIIVEGLSIIMCLFVLCSMCFI
jgi:hypothetical protein